MCIRDRVTLDLRMPGIGGFDVLRYIRDHPEHGDTKVLIVSGQSVNEINAAVLAGADAGLQKPFKNRDLLQEIETLLGPPARPISA